MRRLLFAVLLLPACSLVLMEPPTPGQPGPPRCSEGAALPLFDLLLGGGDVALAIFAANIETTPATRDSQKMYVGASIIAAIAHVGSALYGDSVRDRCREAWRKYGEQDAPKPRRESAGSRGMACYPNQTCNDGLTCDTFRGYCVDGAAMGREGGPCYPNRTCTAPLVCRDKTCTSVSSGD